MAGGTASMTDPPTLRSLVVCISTPFAIVSGYNLICEKLRNHKVHSSMTIAFKLVEFRAPPKFLVPCPDC
jgi:hypothetical protein